MGDPRTHGFLSRSCGDGAAASAAPAVDASGRVSSNHCPRAHHLLVFEMATEMFLGTADIPLAVWGAVTAIGLVYVMLFCLAQPLGFDGPYRAARAGGTQ